MKTVGEQAREYRERSDLSVRQMAERVQRAGARNVKRQHIELLESGQVQHPRWIGALATAMKTQVDDLLKGRFQVAAAGTPSLEKSIDNVESKEIATSGRQNPYTSHGNQQEVEIPLSAPSTPDNLKNTLWLLASQIVQLHADQRTAVMGFVAKIGENPNNPHNWIEMAGAVAPPIAKVFRNPELNEAMEAVGQEGFDQIAPPPPPGKTLTSLLREDEPAKR